MTMHEPPVSVLGTQDVSNPIRPLRGLVHPLHLDLERLDVGRVSQLGRHHGRHVLVAHGAALELSAGPVPAPGDRLPALLVTAPAVEAGRVVTVRIERFDSGDVAVGDLGHGSMQARDGVSEGLRWRL